MKQQFVTETIFLSERWRNERQTEAVGQKMPRKGTSLRRSPNKQTNKYKTSTPSQALTSTLYHIQVKILERQTNKTKTKNINKQQQKNTTNQTLHLNP